MYQGWETDINVNIVMNTILKLTLVSHLFDRKLIDYVIQQDNQKLLTEKARYQPEDTLTLSNDGLGKLSINIHQSKLSLDKSIN